MLGLGTDGRGWPDCGGSSQRSWPPLRESWAASGRELYYDHCHLTPDGNAVVSEALAKWLGEEGLLTR